MNEKYKGVKHFSKEWDVSKSRIATWYKEGRLKGAIKPNIEILIPIDTGRPAPRKAGRPTKTTRDKK